MNKNIDIAGIELFLERTLVPFLKKTSAELDLDVWVDWDGDIALYKVRLPHISLVGACSGWIRVDENGLSSIHEELSLWLHGGEEGVAGVLNRLRNSAERPLFPDLKPKQMCSYSMPGPPFRLEMPSGIPPLEWYEVELQELARWFAARLACHGQVLRAFEAVKKDPASDQLGDWLTQAIEDYRVPFQPSSPASFAA